MSAARRAVPQRGQRGTIPASRLKNNPLRMRRRTARSAARRSVDAVTRFERVLAKSIYLRSAAHVPFYVPLVDNFGSVNRALRCPDSLAKSDFSRSIYVPATIAGVTPSVLHLSRVEDFAAHPNQLQQLARVMSDLVWGVCFFNPVPVIDPGYMSRKIPAVYMSCMSQNFRLFHVSNLSVRNFRIFLLMYPGS